MISKKNICISLILFFNIFFIAAQTNVKVLVFSKTAGFRHKSIETGKEKFKEWALKENWNIKISEDINDLSDKELSIVDVLVFLSPSGDIFNDNAKKSMMKFIHNGGGFVGIHYATDSTYNWPWYHNMIGAKFKNHPKIQEATIDINHNSNHPAVAHFGNSFTIIDEWYNFKDPILNHMNVVMTLNEMSYSGGEMGSDHPIAWYNYYEGGRVFYTGLGHTNEIYSNPAFEKHIIEAVNWTAKKTDIPLNKGWTNLLDENLSKWDKFIGVPHESIQLEGVAKSVDGKTGIPLGLNNDPKNVFSAINENNETVLYITGEIYGGLTSKQEYKNYHFKADFKWGEKKWEPRLNRKRDSGILYHCNGAHGTFWNVWMSSLECQVQEGDCGDFIALNNVYGDVPSDRFINEKGKPYFVYNPKGKLVSLKGGPGFESGQASKNKLFEKPNGEWNTLEVICVGTTSIHVVNSHVVNVVKNARYDVGGKTIPISSGKIQIQSEAAEAYYKNIQIKPIAEFPKKYKKQAKL